MSVWSEVASWLARPCADGDLIDRELSWLDFNGRVLALAADPDQRPLERAKYLAIFESNLDEFFQVRVAGLKDMVAAGVLAGGDGAAPRAELAAIRSAAEELSALRDRVFSDGVRPALAEAGIEIVRWEDLDEVERKTMVEVFENRVFPVLTPLAVDPGHPFPYISNLSLNLAVSVRDPATDERRFARVKVPPNIPRFLAVGETERFLPLEELISAHLDTLFPAMTVEEVAAFRVVRNADLTLEEEEADDLLAAVEVEVRRRRFGRAVRLQLAEEMSAEMAELVTEEMDVEPSDVYRDVAPLDMGGLWALHNLDRPDLKDAPWSPVTQPRLRTDDDDRLDMFGEIRGGDLLVHHPYSSFSTSTEAFIAQAAADPDVLAIKQTLYRTSGDSPIVRSLIRAAEAGKQVAVLVELKARFDEQANIAWARQLEQAGVHVVYGLVGLKTHAKTALVVRQESDGIRRYCHVGTGNYNPTTARVYEDLALFTADPDIGDDIGQLFNFLTGFGRKVPYRRIITAPHGLREAIVALIDAEAAAGESGRISMKMNALVDPAIIEALCRASQAGVTIDLVVRGICRLRPGVEGVSERITVRSIVGRYLEHSRIYVFGNGGGPGVPAYYLTSADMMERNLDRRVEVMVPISEPELQARLQQVLDVNLADDRLAWSLSGDGGWQRVVGTNEVETHLELQRLAEIRAGRRTA